MPLCMAGIYFSIMKKIIAIPFLLLSTIYVVKGQSLNTWLDSMAKPDFIAKEYLMEELVFERAGSNKQYVNQTAVSRTEDILEKTEGVWMIKRGAYAAEPVIRGITGNRLLVTIDGMRIKGACTDKMDPATSYIEPTNLEKFELSKGGGNFQYGNALGGALNFNIKKPVFNPGIPFSGKVETRYNSVSNGIDNALQMNYSRDNYAFLGGITYRKNNNYSDGSGSEIAHSGYNKLNYNFSVSRKNTSSLLNFSYIGDRAWNIGYPALPMDVTHANANIYTLEYTRWPSVGFFNEYIIKVYYNAIDHLMDDSQREVEVRMDMPGNSQTTGGYFQGTKRLSDKSIIKIKTDANHSFLMAEMTMYDEEAPPMFMLTWPEISAINSGIHGLLEYSIHDHWKLNAGLRIELAKNSMNSDLGQAHFSVFDYEKFSSAFITPSGSAELERKLGKSAQSSFSISYTERAPDESEQFGFYLYNSQDGHDYLGNPILGKEKSWQAQWSGAVKSKYMEVNGQFYYYLIEDYIFANSDPALSAMTPGAIGVRRYINIDFAHYAGFELSALVMYNDWRLKSNVKYTSAVKNDGSPLPLIPPLKWNNSVEYQSPFGMSVRVDIDYSTAQDNINQEFGEDKTPGFIIASLHLQQKILQTKNQNLLLQGGIENLTDKFYHEHLDWNKLPRPGRNFYAGLKFWF